MKATQKNKFVNFYRQHRRMPSYAEISTLLGFRSKNSAYYFVNQLLKDGLVSKDRSGKLAPAKLYGEVPLLGLIEAGFPSPAEEELVDTMSLDDYLIDNKDATYILKVKGDSMIDAGICEGDMVIVERTNTPKVGQIVIAEIDGQWTMKYLRKKDGRFFLEAANQKYPPFLPSNELKIAAVVKAVVRKY